jgi:hypothetical protein
MGRGCMLQVVAGTDPDRVGTFCSAAGGVFEWVGQVHVNCRPFL